MSKSASFFARIRAACASEALREALHSESITAPLAAELKRERESHLLWWWITNSFDFLPRSSRTGDKNAHCPVYRQDIRQVWTASRINSFLLRKHSNNEYCVHLPKPMRI